MQPDVTDTHAQRRITTYGYLAVVLYGATAGLLAYGVDSWNRRGGLLAPLLAALLCFLIADMVCWPRRHAKAPAPPSLPSERFVRITINAFDKENPEHVAQLEDAIRPRVEQSDAAMQLSVAQRIATPTSRRLPPA